MSKRVFTMVFWGSIVAPVMPIPIPFQSGGVQTWLAQEDIEVVGAQASIFSTTPSQNDGKATAEVELSQVGVFDKDGAIIKAAASEYWNTAPAGIAEVAGHIELTFAPPLSIPIKEEGLLYVNTSALGKTAATSTFDYAIIVFYTKKGSR